jgi:hypothetical protein
LLSELKKPAESAPPITCSRLVASSTAMSLVVPLISNCTSMPAAR